MWSNQKKNVKLKIKDYQSGWWNPPSIKVSKFPYQLRRNLTIITAQVPGHEKHTSKFLHSVVCVTEEINQNLNTYQ